MPGFQPSFAAQSVIVAKDVAARERLRARLEKVLADDFPGVIGRISPLELGPPVGWPVQYRVNGPDVAQLREIALKLAQVVAANPQAAHVNFDWIEPARQVRIRVDQDGMAFHCASFFTLRDGLISEAFEYWVTEGSEEPPEWRARFGKRSFEPR